MPVFVPDVAPETFSLLQAAISRWGDLWGMPELADELSIRVSGRFRTSLGSYRSRRSEIALASWLLDGPTKLLEEVLCHEAAHAGVHRRFGARVRPHGSEWRALMEQAGMPARVRIPAEELPREPRARLTKTAAWEHRCPVCQATRVARTRVTRWRCRACREQGRTGELVIERLADQVAVHA